MPRATSEKVGKGPCPICGEGLIFRRSKGGMLTFKCDNCDASGYASPGGDAAAKWGASIAKPAIVPALEAHQEPTPKAAEKPLPKAPPPPPAKRVVSSVFSLGDL